MLAKQVSKHKEIYCTSDMPLAKVFNLMLEQNCKCMPVVESPTHKNIIGTITEHDICLKLINGGLNPQRISAGRVMNGNFTTVNADASIDECAELILLTEAERLFVIDENGAFMGILTEKELKTNETALNFETVIKDLSVTALPAKSQVFY